MDISAEIAAIQAASQGSELRQPLVGALNKLNSGALPAVTVSDAGKILKVGANGWEVGEKSGYMPVPTATKQIAENGTYDVTDYASAVVNVSGGSGAVIQAITITQNGTYVPPFGVDGFSPVIVNAERILTPTYEGLSYAFVSQNITFDTWTTKTNYMSFYEVEANRKYFIFAANSSGNRFRAAFFSGKNINDFTHYIENPYANTTVYTGDLVTNVNGNSTQRFFYTPNAQGTIVILTSSEGSSAPVVVGIM